MDGGSNLQQLLQSRAILITKTGQKCAVNKLLGSGGQGEVYEVEISDKKYALKWYYRNQATEAQRIIIENLVQKGSPDSRFLWPLDIVDSPNSETFGYIMPLRPKEYKSIVDMMTRKAEPTFRTLCTAGINLVDSYLQLHSKGLCYRDISFGNVFLNPSNGDVLICDNDNVDVTGADCGGVLGTARFMAPEIVRGEVNPSTETDLFSLAILLFYMFMLHHPLEGKIESEIKCFDTPAMKKIYGDAPIFIWDPIDVSNRPVLGYQDNALIYWNIYPEFIKELFTRAFTDGIKNPKSRVLEIEWRKAFIKLRDSIIYCGNCGLEIFYDAAKLKNGEKHTCWGCIKEVTIPPRIKIAQSIVMLNSNSKIYMHHIKDNLDFNTGVAEVTQHPKNPDLWGLKNVSNELWSIVKADGNVASVEPGKSVSLSIGTRINFGTVEGEIRL